MQILVRFCALFACACYKDTNTTRRGVGMENQGVHSSSTQRVGLLRCDACMHGTCFNMHRRCSAFYCCSSPSVSKVCLSFCHQNVLLYASRFLRVRGATRVRLLIVVFFAQAAVTRDLEAKLAAEKEKLSKVKTSLPFQSHGGADDFFLVPVLQTPRAPT